MTCNVYLYHLPIKLNSKNYVLDNMEQYLGTLTATHTFTEYQYQRMLLEMSFKFNLSQDYQTYNYIQNPNYIKIIDERRKLERFKTAFRKRQVVFSNINVYYMIKEVYQNI